MTYDGTDRDDLCGGYSESRATGGGNDQRWTPEQVLRNPERYVKNNAIDIALGFNKSFLRVPQTWIRGGIPAVMDRVSPGLWRLFILLWHYGNLPMGLIFPAKRTLAREAGFKDPRTVGRKLAILEKGDLKKNLPPLLERLPGNEEDRGHRIRYRFRPEGLALLQQIAEANVEEETRRRAAISKQRRKAGRIGARERWTPKRSHNEDDL